MTTQIDEALDYLGKSDERFQTILIGGGLLFVSQYVFVFSGISTVTEYFASSELAFLTGTIRVVVLGIGMLAFVIPLGFLLEVNTAVAKGEETPPSFYPITVRRWFALTWRGLIGLAVFAGTVFVLIQGLNFALAEVNRLLPTMKLTGIIFDLIKPLTIVCILFFIPYVVLAVLLLFERERKRTRLRSILVFKNRSYLTAWVLAIILLVFNSDFISYLSELFSERRIFPTEPGSESIMAAFGSFYILVSIVYLFSKALTEPHSDDLDH